MAHLLELQSGVVSRRQLRRTGVTDVEIRRLLRRRQWATVHAGVYVDHTGPVTWLQRAWAAVLATAPSALYGASAVRAADGPGRRDHDDGGPLHVAIPEGRRCVAPAGVVVHRIPEFSSRLQANTSPPRLRIEEAVLDMAASARDELAAIAVLSDAVRARRTTSDRLHRALEARAWIQRRAFLAGVVSDIGNGTCSVLEHAYLDLVERPHGLPLAERQVHESAGGSLYRDVEYTRTGLIVELDGRLHHDSALARDADLDRDLDALVSRRDTVRLGWGQVFRRPCRTAERVGVLLAQRGWQGSLTRCDRCGVR